MRAVPRVWMLHVRGAVATRRSGPRARFEKIFSQKTREIRARNANTNARANPKVCAMAAAGDMSFVSHMVLGAPILLTCNGLLEISNEFPLIPASSRRKCTVDGERKHDACMLLPHDAEFFSLVVDKVGGVYVQPQGGGDRIYCIQPQFASLARLLPGDSACRAIAYTSVSNVLVLGLYDLTRLEGTDLRPRTILERHAMLHETVALNFRQYELHAAQAHAAAARARQWDANVRVHWVGWQEACLEVLEKSRDLPFKASHICRLEEDEYVKLLAPVRTSWS